MITNLLTPSLLEEEHQITFHWQCISSLMIQVYKCLSGQSLDVMNDTFKLWEKICNLRNFQIFQAENLHSLRYRLDAISYRASKLWQQVSIDTRGAASVALFKNCIKPWKYENCPWRKMFIQSIYSKCRLCLIRAH